MELYILDDQLRRTEFVENYKSMIWTDRFNTVGDFQLIVKSDSQNRSRFQAGVMLGTDVSYHVMIVDTVENKQGDDGTVFLTITGKSFENLMADRVVKLTMSDTTTDDKWVFTGTPGDAVNQLFTDYAATPILNPADTLPYISTESVQGNWGSEFTWDNATTDWDDAEGTWGTMLYPPDTIPMPSDEYTFSLDLGDLLSAIQAITSVYNLGYRLSRGPDNGEMYFDVYSGSDRTSQQTENPAVIFSTDLDNILDSTELKSSAGFKNVAYVFAANGFEIVYADGVDESVSGIDRRVLLVDASDITDTAGPDLTAQLVQKGKDALAGTQNTFAFDGEISQISQYRYGTDYQLGDLVELRNSDGVIESMRVTEQIFVQDDQGERSYPTLTSNQLITPGSWYSWGNSQVWDDADGVWADQ